MSIWKRLFGDRPIKTKVLRAMDQYMMDPDQLFAELRRIGTRSDILTVLDEIESDIKADMEAGRSNRSFVQTTAMVQTIRQMSHML